MGKIRSVKRFTLTIQRGNKWIFCAVCLNLFSFVPKVLRLVAVSRRNTNEIFPATVHFSLPQIPSGKQHVTSNFVSLNCEESPSGWTGTSSFVLKVPLRYLRPSIIYSVPCDRIVQGAYINNSLFLARKYARIFVRGHYLFREANSFPRAKLDENCELRGTDNVQRQISEHSFAPNGDYRAYYPSNLLRNARSFEIWGIFNNYSMSPRWI